MYELVNPYLCKFLREEDGAAAVEYAILVAVVAFAIFAMTFPFDIKVIFNLTTNSVSNMISSAAN